MFPKKTLVLIRGCPGSGKQTLAETLVDAAQGDGVALSTLKVQGGQFNRETLSQAHDACFEQAVDAMKGGLHVVAVHNTFTQLWEMERYVDAATSLDYSVFIIHCANAFGPDEDISQQTLIRHERRFEVCFGPNWVRKPKPEPKAGKVRVDTEYAGGVPAASD